MMERNGVQRADKLTCEQIIEGSATVIEPESAACAQGSNSECRRLELCAASGH